MRKTYLTDGTFDPWIFPRKDSIPQARFTELDAHGRGLSESCVKLASKLSCHCFPSDSRLPNGLRFEELEFDVETIDARSDCGIHGFGHVGDAREETVHVEVLHDSRMLDATC